MRVVVTGGRGYTDHAFVFAALDAIHAVTPITGLAHGGAGKVGPISGRPIGVDLLAGAWAEARGVPQTTFPVSEAEWRRYQRAAGPIRNRRMLDEYEPDALVAFPGGKDTADCVNAARERGIEVLRQRPEA